PRARASFSRAAASGRRLSRRSAPSSPAQRDSASTGDQPQMTIKFTQQAQRAVQLAHEEARGLNHGYVGTEHLLLGLLREETGIAGEVLRRFGVDSARVRAEVEKQVLRGPEGSCSARELPLTPRAKHAIDYAIDDVRFMRQPMVDTDHLLVGLIHEPEGVAG